ncbi:nickel-dependent hydrogenase large subunit [Corynebacterium mendelii]|uniref:Nickel-dependent hydrogenase large subunit n=1 Tax=Corynebacterium mendelii TaxID=2765362 RepID=A0A939E033_9CORY|nr:nickel-dependent hydrogenase large subunit [Corynebacterium mendelii]MBN9643979.1 nickel-dependent hydrogenase large subunit [Corynebacterium mendelii]
MGGQTISLDQFVDPFEARVVWRDNPDGTVSAHFDLSGLPRLDPVLTGKPVATIPDTVKRLCGICPVAHHLAGVAALEDMLGHRTIPPTAQAVRSLLAAGSQLEQLARHLLTVDRQLMADCRAIGKKAMAIAGCPGHFPAVAIPGGVTGTVDRTRACDLIPEVNQLIARLRDFPATTTQPADGWREFTGGSVRLTDKQSNRRILGDVVEITSPTGAVTRLTAHDFDRLVEETVPGASAPRPVITLSGTSFHWRVGPVAQYPGQPTPWAAIGRALLGAADDIATCLAADELVEGDRYCPPDSPRTTTGVGMVDGPRGLLVHTYRTGEPGQDTDGVLTGCRILTPTAQNEPWLADMLTRAVAAGGKQTDLEQGIRTADPCLPCTSAPPGAMGVHLDQQQH